jgi:hypothetical protein
VTEAYSNPLQRFIDEFKNISPEITNALIFKSDGQILANTQATTQDQTKKVIDNFNNISQCAETIGGIENLTIQAAERQLNITAIYSNYLATVSSRVANQESVKSLTHVLVPIVIRLVDQVASMPKETQMQQTIRLDNPSTEETVLPVEGKPKIEPIPELKPPFAPFLPITPINQFMVEKIGGLLVPADTVRIDADVIAKWSDLYDGKQITMVNIEALDGKRTTCKFKPIKEAKTNAKGIIQIPEKILQTLQSEKGKLVMVKPIIDKAEV